jgi:hypothetical protein
VEARSTMARTGRLGAAEGLRLIRGAGSIDRRRLGQRAPAPRRGTTPPRRPAVHRIDLVRASSACRSLGEVQPAMSALSRRPRFGPVSQTPPGSRVTTRARNRSPRSSMATIS